MSFSESLSNLTHEHSPLTNRRSAIGALSLAGLGLIASSTPASAFIFQKKDSDVPKVVVVNGSSSSNTKRKAPVAGMDDLPSEWVQMQGNLLNDYNRYLSSLRLQRLTPHQVIEAHAKEKGGVWNKLPPKAWWTRMGYTLRVVDRIAVQLNQPVEEIVSAYRCPIYNARCSGAKKGSWHQANVAVDVRFPVRASVVTSTSRNLRDRGLFKGGVGGYSSFTHIDTRGTNMNW
jgi:hypothetical protein